ncbi:MAG: hypothetical protein H6Q73_1829 [Firmicutes bacterium]|nr:hypothetical protein [Bacillota bacterium]
MIYMDEYLVTASTGTINFGAIGKEEILQNVRYIINTPKYSVPLAREFGIDLTLLDKPMPVAKQKLAAELVTAISKYETRVGVTGVTFTGDAETGKLVPKVKVYIK